MEGIHPQTIRFDGKQMDVYCKYTYDDTARHELLRNRRHSISPRNFLIPNIMDYPPWVTGASARHFRPRIEAAAEWLDWESLTGDVAHALGRRKTMIWIDQVCWDAGRPLICSDSDSSVRLLGVSVWCRIMRKPDSQQMTRSK